jgi:hypothetical protein
MDCLRTSHQIVSRFDAAKIAAVEVGTAQSPNWDECSKLMNGLRELGAVVENATAPDTWEINRNTIRAAGLSFGTTNMSSAHFAVRERVRYTLAKTVAEFLRENCFVSENGTQVISPSAQVVSFGGVPFDLLGFSFARGLASFHRNPELQSLELRPTPIAGDCLVEECNKAYAEAFMRRLKEATSKATNRFVPFIFAQRFEHEAFGFLRKEGVLMWTHSQLLGRKTAEAVQRVLEITEDIIVQRNINPQLFLEMFEGFENFGSLFGGLKGKMFELMMAYFFQKRSGNVRIGWQVQRDWLESPDQPAKVISLDDIEAGNYQSENESDLLQSPTYDIDLVAILMGDAFIVECKGIASDKEVEDGDVRRHFTERTPLTRHLLSQDRLNRIKRFHGIVVTTGGFEDLTFEKLRRSEYRSRPDTTLALWDRQELLRQLEIDEQRELIQVVDRFFT